MLTVDQEAYQAMYGNVEEKAVGAHLCSCACNCSCHCNCRRFGADGELEW